MQSTARRFTHDDGTATILETWGERGPVILCVHGMVSSRQAWTRFAQRFSHAYRVVAYDQRGHGDSAGVAGPMSLARGVRDMQNVAAAVGARVLLGHSWGGAVVVRAGRNLNVDAVAAIDPMIVQIGDDWYAEYIEELNETFALTGADRGRQVRDDFRDWHALDIEGKVHAVHAMTSDPIAALRDQNRDGAWDLRADIAAYDKPLLLLMAGAQGSIVPPDVMADVAARHAKDVRIVTFEDQGHNLYRADFERFAETFDTFLKDVLAA